MSSAVYRVVFESILKSGPDKHSMYLSPGESFDRRVSRIDLGRQTGKTTAISDTVIFEQEFDFVILTHNTGLAEHISRKVLERRNQQLRPENIILISNMTTNNIEKIYSQVRLYSKRPLIIFMDEPMHKTESVLDDVYNIFKLDLNYKVIVVGVQ